MSPRETPEVTYIDDEEEKEERRTWRVELGRLRTHEPMGLGMSHFGTPRTNYSSFSRHSRINLNRHVELSSSLKAQHVVIVLNDSAIACRS